MKVIDSALDPELYVGIIDLKWARAKALRSQRRVFNPPMRPIWTLVDRKNCGVTFILRKCQKIEYLSAYIHPPRPSKQFGTAFQLLPLADLSELPMVFRANGP